MSLRWNVPADQQSVRVTTTPKPASSVVDNRRPEYILDDRIGSAFNFLATACQRIMHSGPSAAGMFYPDHYEGEEWTLENMAANLERLGEMFREVAEDSKKRDQELNEMRHEVAAFGSLICRAMNAGEP